MEPEKKVNGAVVSLIIIIIILIAGGIYMWQASKNSPAEEGTQTESESVTRESENVTNEDANALNALEADLQTTDTSTGVDANTVY